MRCCLPKTLVSKNLSHARSSERYSHPTGEKSRARRKRQSIKTRQRVPHSADRSTPHIRISSNRVQFSEEQCYAACPAVQVRTHGGKESMGTGNDAEFNI